MSNPKRVRPLFFTVLLISLFLLSMFAVLPLQSSAESLNPWHASTNFPKTNPPPSCVTWQGYVYCIAGGKSYFASISSSGVGAWKATTNYPIFISDTSCVASSGYIYCIAGYSSGSGANASEYYAPLSSTGVGAWSRTGTSGYYPSTSDLSCAAANGYIYCVGGANGGEEVQNVSFATLSDTGIGTWAATTQYPFAVVSESCVISASYIYCVGGLNSNPQDQNLVYYAPISSSGVGNWKQTSTYPLSLDSTSCAVNSGNLYCVGGEEAASNTADVFYSPISSSGGLGSWVGTTSYPVAISYESCVSPNEYIYCVAGVEESYTNSVYYTSVASSTSSQLTVTSKNTSGQVINGYYAVLYNSRGGVIGTGFTPVTFTVTDGASYSVKIDNFKSCSFSQWSDGVTSNPRTISISSNTVLTAIYNCGTGTGSSVSVNSIDQNNNVISGYYVVLRDSAGSVITTGFTPKAFSTTSGSSYSIQASSYKSCIFSHWSNGVTSNPMSFTATSSPQSFTAVYNCGTVSSSVTINSVNQNGSPISGYYVVLYNSAGGVLGTGFTTKTFPTTSGNSYSVRADSYGSCVFTHWSNGATSDPMPFTASSSAQTFTAVYNCS